MSAALGLGIAGTALGVLSSISGMNSQNAQYKLQARQAALQAQQMDIQKRILADRYRTKRTLLEGSARAKAGASGVKISGSVADSISQSLAEMQMEEAQQKYNISIGQSDANFASAQALAMSKSKAGYLNAASTLLSGASQIAGAYAESAGGAKNTDNSGGIIGRGDD